MTVWALLCGLFYGAFGYAVWSKAVWRRQVARAVERMEALPWPDEGCVCDECCDCGRTDVDLYAMSHTGYEDG